MKETAEQPLLDLPADDAPKKAPKRRAATTPAKSRTTKKATSKVAVAEVKEPEEIIEVAAAPKAKTTKTTAAPKKKTTTTSRKKAAATTDSTDAEPSDAPAGEVAAKQTPQAPAPTPAPIEALAAPTAAPEAKAPEAPAPVTPEALASEAAAAAAAAAGPSAAPVASGTPVAPGPRKYPVYVPRTVAKQMEAEGKSIGVAVNSSEDLPKELLDQIAAATAAPQRRERPPRPERPQHQPSQQSAPPPEMLPPQLASGSESLPAELVGAPTILEGEPKPEELAEGEGIIEISGKGFGFLRDPKRNFAQAPHDIFVTPEIVKHYHLRDGQMLRGVVRRGQRGAQLHKLLTINGDPAEEVRNLPAFDELTVISPEPRITLETTPDRYTTRIVDLMCPIGRGQRALVVAPPRTGKTTFLLHMADAVKKNHPDMHLMFLLIDERPEEVTDIKRSVPGAEVFASSNDLDVKSHTRIAQLAIERARRLVEQGKHVFILLDSITRVGRAFNNAMTGGGRTGSGGLDSRALEIPRRLFASARNTEEAGSLTIVGTTLVETNSRGDEVIFQEFKGTGNMELVLDRKIAEQRVYPAIDIFMSGTRREELLISPEDLHKIHIIRRGLAGYKPLEAVERLLFFLKKFPTNAQMLAGIPG